MYLAAIFVVSLISGSLYEIQGCNIIGISYSTEQ